jgi:hypothetical protein
LNQDVVNGINRSLASDEIEAVINILSKKRAENEKDSLLNSMSI